MTLRFHPNPGDVLICDFTKGFRPPEMIKSRPVVIISQRRRSGASVVTVVSLSTTAPHPVEAHHYQVDVSGLPGRFGDPETWAKCDMVITVALHRLDRIKIRHGGNRTYHVGRLPPKDLAEIRRRVAKILGLT